MPNNKNNEYYNLCLNLFSAETEDEVINILKKAGYWDDLNVWRPFGDNENNWSVIGNQQGNPDAALVEKLVNSIDAVLIKECHLNKILPESNQAPRSINEALEKFFNIKNGNLGNLSGLERAKLAEHIGLVATGTVKNVNYTIFDLGEGQTPQKMPDTLLSISKSNKLKIPFVQGKFNMGGTGVLPFCGNQNFQLVISRRHPAIVDSRDSTSPFWGFTIVRRQAPMGGRRSSMFTYLAPDWEVPIFQTTGMEVIGTDIKRKSPVVLEWGTIIKLYNYELTAALKTNIKFDLYYRLSLLFSKPSLPIRFFEGRPKYSGQSPEATLSGLHVRLQDDRGNNIEDGFPTSHALSINGELMTATVYAFRKGRAEHYRKNEGIVFLVNGQTHAIINQNFFSRKNVNMGYLADSILLIIDATNINERVREDLFMNSRDRIRRGDLTNIIEERLEELLHNHQGLRELRERRRREQIEERLSDAKPLQEVLDEILKKSPSLAALFMTGNTLSNPIKSKQVGEQEKFEGKRFPTYFHIISKDIEKDCPINQKFRVHFETDVVNDYFERDNYQGRFTLYQNNLPAKDYSVDLTNGMATATVYLPADVNLGDTLYYHSEVEDDTRSEPFINEFVRYIVEPRESNTDKVSKRKPAGNNGNGKREAPDKLSLPNVTDVHEANWDEHKFDKFSALRVIDNGEGGYDFYVNIDNIYLRTELKALGRNEDPKLFEAQFRYSLVLIGLALLKESSTENDQVSETLENRVFNVTRLLAPILLPMIGSLGDLKLEDIVG